MRTKTLTFYQCEICGRDYDNADDANACELSHGTIAIERVRYDKDWKVSDTFPVEVVITDGERNALYVFHKIYRTTNE